MSAPAVTGLLRDGATMIFNHIDVAHKAVGSLTKGLERALLCRVGANMYAALGTCYGFDVHFDDHDVFILQVSGRKHWQVFGPKSPKIPSRNSKASNMEMVEPIWERSIGAGDLLYIPRGWWHFAKPCNEPTIHLTIGIRSPWGINLVEWVIERLRSHDQLRVDLPRFATPQLQEEYLASIQEILAAALREPDLIGRYLRTSSASSEPQLRLGLPWSATSNLHFDSMNLGMTFSVSRPLDIIHRTESCEVTVPFDGKNYAFAEAAAPLFSYLHERQEMSVGEFFQQWELTWDRDELAAFLADLVRIGLVVIHEARK